MRLRKFGHCCLLVQDKGERLLLDSGVFSSDFSGLDGLTAVLITHVHADHLDVGRLHSLLERNPDATVLCDEMSATALAGKGVPGRVLHGGDVVDVGVSLRVYETEHAVIHPDLPNVPNLGYLVEGRFFYGGDAFIIPSEPVEVLAVPVGGVWMKASESIDYLRSIAPRVAVPVHDHQDVWADWIVSLFRDLGPGSAAVRTLAGETAQEV